VEGGKRIAVIVLLVALILGVLRWLIRSHYAARRPPKAIRSQRLEMIDIETYEVFTRTLEEWTQGGTGENGRFKNPRTGKPTMALVTVCVSCGEKVPAAEFGAEDTPDVVLMKQRAYICPKCGKHAYPQK